MKRTSLLSPIILFFFNGFSQSWSLEKKANIIMSLSEGHISKNARVIPRKKHQNPILELKGYYPDCIFHENEDFDTYKMGAAVTAIYDFVTMDSLKNYDMKTSMFKESDSSLQNEATCTNLQPNKYTKGNRANYLEDFLHMLPYLANYSCNYTTACTLTLKEVVNYSPVTIPNEKYFALLAAMLYLRANKWIYQPKMGIYIILETRNERKSYWYPADANFEEYTRVFN